MTSCLIERLTTRDARYDLPDGAGSDSHHTDPQYSFAVTKLTSARHTGTGLVLTLGGGNELVCAAIEQLGGPLDRARYRRGDGGLRRHFHRIADHHQLRWLGPHKGVVHLALASITNACFDLWAKARGVPLWKLLLDLSPEQIVALLDLSYLEDVLTAATHVISWPSTRHPGPHGRRCWPRAIPATTPRSAGSATATSVWARTYARRSRPGSAR